MAHTDMVSALKDLETREKGVDICVLMDGTGSMVCSNVLLIIFAHLSPCYSPGIHSCPAILACYSVNTDPN